MCQSVSKPFKNSPAFVQADKERSRTVSRVPVWCICLGPYLHRLYQDATNQDFGTPWVGHHKSQMWNTRGSEQWEAVRLNEWEMCGWKRWYYAHGVTKPGRIARLNQLAVSVNTWRIKDFSTSQQILHCPSSISQACTPGTSKEQR